MSCDYWLERLEIKKAQLALLDQALSAFLADGAKQTVSLDTGQTRYSWNRSELGSIKNYMAALEEGIARLEIRCGITNPGVFIRPAH